MKDKLAWIFLGFAALVLLILYLISWSLALNAPLSIEYEGPCLWAAIRLAHGLSIYNPDTLINAPWEVEIYPPLFYLVCVPFQVLAGNSYWGLRLVSILSLVISFVSSYRVFYRTTNSYYATMVALVAYSSFLPVWSLSYKGRVDMLAMALSIVAIDLFLVAYDKRIEQIPDTDKLSSRLFRLLSFYSLFILCSVLAIFTKQTAVIIPLTISIFLLTKNKYLDFLIVSLGTGASACITLLALDLWTNGGFVQHMLFLRKIPISFDDLNNHLIWIGGDWAKLLLIPILICFLGRRKPNTLDTTLPVAFILIGGMLTFYSLGTMYASVTHAMHFYWACAWLIALCLAVAPVELSIVLLCSSLLSTYILYTTIPSLSSVVSKMPATLRLLKQEDLEDTTMFVEDPVLALEVGAKPLFVDVATFLQVWKIENRSLDQLNKAIIDSKYSAVIVNRHDSQFEKPANFWSVKLIRLIRKHYRYRGTVIGNGEVQDIFLKKDDLPIKERSTLAPEIKN